MAASNSDDHFVKGEPAKADSPLQGRYAALADSALAQPDDDEQEKIDLLDITKIPMGARAIALNSITLAWQDKKIEEELKAKKRKAEEEAEEARELASLTEWNHQMTVINGLEMTNEEAQQARRHVAEHSEQYADWAVRNGLISDEQREEFEHSAWRRLQLEDRRGRGVITDDEKREENQLNRSRVGRAIDAATAYDHENQGFAPTAATTPERANEGLRSKDQAFSQGAYFQSAPPLSDAFAAANAEPQEKRPLVVAPVAPSIKATGLDL